MDTLRGYDAATDQDAIEYGMDDAAVEPPPEIGSDERRMHVRAYHYWASLLGDRNLPSIADLHPGQIDDFGPHSVLLDFTSGLDNPRIVYLGTALRQECDIEGHVEAVADVPARSLLSRLTDHYLQIIANAAPIGFEAEFVNQRGLEIMYRGILMPFSSDGETIDFVYGVINWKEMASRDVTDALAQEVGEALRSAPATTGAGSAGLAAVWADGPSHPAPLDVSDFLPELELDEADMLDTLASPADWLALARESALEAATSDARSRVALYRALGLAYDFMLASRDAPDKLTEILDDAGIKAQARSPMTAIVKLVFGADYDKTRLTEYATVLDHAAGKSLGMGALSDYLGSYAGGIKGLVRDERAARQSVRPSPTDRVAAARARLKAAPSLAGADVATDADGFAVLVGRREPDGSIAIVAALPTDARLAQRVVTAAAS